MPKTGERDSVQQAVSERRFIRLQYQAVQRIVHDEGDDLGGIHSQKFKSIVGKVDIIHQLVKNPREQVVDAYALLEIANKLKFSVQAESNGGMGPSDFVTALLRGYSQSNIRASMLWEDIGLFASDVFRKAKGYCTMIGPMNKQLKQRKAVARGKRSRLIELAHPEKLDNADQENTNTDENISIMFDIIKKKRSVKLEYLVLNRNSFAQTVENIFALSFLVKDGRAKINIDDNNYHLVSPRNAPSAKAVAVKDVSFFHFVFRFDFQDWKLMKDSVRAGKELMPQRGHITSKSIDSQKDPELQDSFSVKLAVTKTYYRKRRRADKEQLVDNEQC